MRKKKKMKVINLFGAAGSGKSTTSAGLVYMLNLKLSGKVIEFTPEYFKELVWEDNVKEVFGRQLEVLAEQNKRLSRLEGKVDFVITDCPLPLISLYQPENFKNVIGDTFTELTMKIYNNYENINYLLLRDHHFQSEGRIHNDSQAREIERKLPDYLKSHNINYQEIRTSQSPVDLIFADIKANYIKKVKLK